MCIFMEFSSMSVPYAALRDAACRATASRKSAGDTVTFFVACKSSTTSRHAHKDVTHAVQYPCAATMVAKNRFRTGAMVKSSLALQLKKLASKFDLLAFAWNILRRLIWMLRGQIYLSRNASTSV